MYVVNADLMNGTNPTQTQQNETDKKVAEPHAEPKPSVWMFVVKSLTFSRRMRFSCALELAAARWFA